MERWIWKPFSLLALSLQFNVTVYRIPFLVAVPVKPLGAAGAEVFEHVHAGLRETTVIKRGYRLDV